jgi:putative PIN family toxin of toxin-antitoxin system
VRVFLDTNILASAFGTRGLCADVLREVITRHELVLGEPVIEELAKVLEKKFGFSASRTNDIAAFLRRFPVFPVPDDLSGAVVRDSTDRAILATALVARAEVLVTGDRDLLIIGRREALVITTPRGFWNLLRLKD